MDYKEFESNQVIMDKVSDKGEKIVSEIKKMLNLKSENLNSNGHQVFDNGHSDHSDHMDCGDTYGGGTKQKEDDKNLIIGNGQKLQNESYLSHSNIIGNMQLDINKGKVYNGDDHSDYTDHSDYGDYGD